MSHANEDGRLANASSFENADVQQAKIREIREDRWQQANAAGHARQTDDKPNVVDGNIGADWTWHDETNALLRAAIESANDAIIITDTELDDGGPRFEYVNPAFTAMTGYTLDEVLGKTPRILQGPRTERALLDRLRDDLRHGRVFHGEGINYRKDGTEYVVEWRITAMRSPDGRVLKWVAVQRDVTERRLQELHRDQQLAAERAAREEAERVGRMKDEFLATLSHELRTPLNAILGWTQLLQRGRLSGDDARRAVDTVERNARTQARLIEDLLDMSRIMAGTFRLEPKTTSLDAIVDAALQSCRPAAEAKHVELVSEVAPGVGAVHVDVARMQQVAWNLLTNAIKFTPAGGRVTARIAPAANDARCVELTILDTGMGIDPAFLPFVFDRFRQADATTTRLHGGLGLGLSIVKHLVELHGGTVRASSDGPRRGAQFSVRLPVQAPSAASRSAADPAVPVEAAEPAADVAGLRVLVVDDDDDARAFVRRVLEDHGARVDDAASAEGAIRLLDARPTPAIDLIVSDIGMPMMDGYELIKRVRQRPATAYGKVPAIALTAFARGEDRRRALMAGYQAHVPKPVDAADLLLEVHTMCGRAE